MIKVDANFMINYEKEKKNFYFEKKSEIDNEYAEYEESKYKDTLSSIYVYKDEFREFKSDLIRIFITFVTTFHFFNILLFFELPFFIPKFLFALLILITFLYFVCYDFYKINKSNDYLKYLLKSYKLKR